jgi:hypothetical protein
MYKVDLVGIYGVDAVPPELKGFVHFQANLEKRELMGNERVALLVVQNTESHVTVFLEEIESIEEIDAKLERQEAKLSEEARSALLQVLRS